MCKEDAAQVAEIDRETLSTLWPPPNYQHELRNRLAHYLVACDDGETVDKHEVEPSSGKDSTGLVSRLRRLFRRRLSSDELPALGRHYIIGFTGFWVVADEAHISSIAVREAYRRQGIGELLLLSVFSLAAELEAHIITLEVRASNTTAQRLYAKYGFTQVGVRRAYYIDNREDGILMSTPDINLAAFQAHLQQLKQAHSGKCRLALNQIAR